jgi:hypothetical protein
MNYVWEAALAAIGAGVSPDELRFRPAARPSPYLEVNLPDLNGEALPTPDVEINALYRFADTFAGLIDTTGGSETEPRRALFNVAFHSILDGELMAGMSRWEYQRRFLAGDLADGVFGEKVREAMPFFDKREARLVMGTLLRQYRQGFSTRLLTGLLRELYPDSITYLYTDERKSLLIYLGREKTERLERQLGAIQDLLIPLGYEARLFWERHFGIIGVDETMIPGEIILI